MSEVTVSYVMMMRRKSFECFALTTAVPNMWMQTTSILHTALKYPTDNIMQQLIWETHFKGFYGIFLVWCMISLRNTWSYLKYIIERIGYFFLSVYVLFVWSASVWRRRRKAMEITVTIKDPVACLYEQIFTLMSIFHFFQLLVVRKPSVSTISV